MKSFCSNFPESCDYQLTPSLRLLDLGRNCLTDMSFAFACMPKLGSLNLSLNSLKSIEPLLGKANASLDTLILSDNKIDAISASISNLTALQNFNAENNNVKNFPPEFGLLLLKQFSVLGNPSMLVTGKNASKGVNALMAGLKAKVDPGRVKAYEQMIAELRKQGNASSKATAIPEEWRRFMYKDPLRPEESNPQESKPEF